MYGRNQFTFKGTSIIAGLVAIVGVSTSQGEMKSLLGQLQATADVTITSNGADLTLADALHPIFTGDQVATNPDSAAVVRISGDKGLVYAAAGAEVSFEQDADTYVVNHDEGEMRFLFNTSTPYRVVTDCYVIESAGAASASEPSWTGGRVSHDGGMQTVTTVNGDVTVTSRDSAGGAGAHLCQQNEPITLAMAQKNPAQATTATAAVGGISTTVVGFVVGGVIVAGAVASAADSDNSTPDVGPPTNPVFPPASPIQP